MRNYKFIILISLLSCILFIPFLGAVHLFDWDEINFAEAAREMIVSKNYQDVMINYLPFWEKPPMFIWMQVLSMKVFGINEFAARFPNAICGLFTLIFIYFVARKHFSESFARIWTSVFLCSFLPHLYFKSGIIDPWFNLFIFMSIYLFFLYLTESANRIRFLIMAAILLDFAVLTKGPVAFLLFAFTYGIYFIIRRFKIPTNIWHIITFFLVFVLVGGLWFLVQIANGKMDLVKQFIVYQIRLFTTEDAGHGGFFAYHFVILFFGVFPASVFALGGFKFKNYTNSVQDRFHLICSILFWVVLIIFTIVKTKIVHYSSLCYFPLTFLSAYFINNLLTDRAKWRKWINGCLISVASVYALILIGLQILIFKKDAIIQSGMIKDRFAVANLQANVNWTYLEFLPGIILIAGILLALLYFKKSQLKQRITTILLSSLLFIVLAIVLLVPRIEKISQNAAIEFYISLQHKDCYLETKGFKSYAYLYYSQKPLPDNPLYNDQNWLLKGKIDKPVYIVTRIEKCEEFEKNNPDFSKLYEKNGFVFFVRNP